MGFIRCGALRLPFTWTLIGVEVSVRILLLVGFILMHNLGKVFVRITQPDEWAAHSFPYAEKETFPVPMIAGILAGITCATLLFWLLFMRFVKKATTSETVSDLLYAILSLSLAIFLVAFFVEGMKFTYGRLRPDYLARCFGNDATAWPSPVPAIPVCKDVYSLKIQLDGRKSFPSGHSALTWSVSVWLLLYTYQKLCWFKDSASLRIFVPAMYCILPIYVAISRTSDYRHFPSDVFSGFLLAVLLSAPAFFLYYPLRWHCIDKVSDALYEEPAVLMTSNSSHVSLKYRSTAPDDSATLNDSDIV